MVVPTSSPSFCCTIWPADPTLNDGNAWYRTDRYVHMYVAVAIHHEHACYPASICESSDSPVIDSSTTLGEKSRTSSKVAFI
jgi:hypothetical protein